MQELEAIEKHELDMISLGNTYIMKSHKGEIEIDKDDFIKDKEKGKTNDHTMHVKKIAALRSHRLGYRLG